MASTLLQIRVDDSLKDEASRVFENLGIDTSTAVRMFLKRSVMENGIPFRMTLPRNPCNADRGYRAMMEIGEAAEKSGLSDMSLELASRTLSLDASSADAMASSAASLVSVFKDARRRDSAFALLILSAMSDMMCQQGLGTL